MSAVRLAVNVDHVATVREARHAPYPDPVAAAELAERAGAAGITVHLRADRRHIQDDDVVRLRQVVRGKLNLEMAAAEEMLALAVTLRPDQVTLVPERPEEVTTEGGLDLRALGERVVNAAHRLAEAGITVSLFIDPDPAQLMALAGLAPAAPGITGFELNTDAYARASQSGSAPGELAQLRAAAELGRAHGLHLYAGHGLTTANVGPVAALPGMEELNIGHFLVARAVLVGMGAAVREMLAAIAAAQ